jgi:surfactin synthase thioesterase subunit
MIAYQVARRIQNSGLPCPLHLFFSGRGAPHLKRKDEKIYHLMNDDDFKEEIIKMGGTPPELFEHPELLELFLPLLKNDFKIAETAIVSPETEPLNESITVFLGKEDDLTPGQCDGWKVHTTKLCTIHHFPGGHFFIQQETGKLVKLIDHILRDCYKDRFVPFEKSHATH